ncbi:hypothetical protein HWV62_43597 [Athelia sp. TMB]|nr:hypothetical protein HWV62_43597 [Athelia sp. TMB]
MTTNPSHILIARNSRTQNPSTALTIPTETHTGASGVFRSSGSPPWLLEECETDDIVSDMSSDDDDEPIEIEETFTLNNKLPGKVKIIVESTTFWAHKEILFFASPFFEAALSGSWLETGRPPSMSSIITIAQPPSIPGDKGILDAPEVSFAEIDHEIDLNFDSDTGERSESGEVHTGEPDSEASDTEVVFREDASSKEPLTPAQRAEARDNSLAQLLGGQTAPTRNREVRRIKPRVSIDTSEDDDIRPPKKAYKPAQAKVRRRPQSSGTEAVIVLKEERASTFHDFLKWVYPHLECTITWNNVEGLMNISHKLCVPSLQRECLKFLLTHAAGKPIKAMRIAELFEEEELYRESSRFVLDNPGGWSEQELSTLSQDTLLKLEKRRNWFLERVLKLGLTPLAKEYQCCSTCPDSANCARLLEEKWRQAYNAVFRFGPCQPSIVYRFLRTLEGVSPPLSLTHLACQTTAKAFTATLFDRMFSLGVRGSGTDTAPLGARVAAVAESMTGPRRHFLYCALKPEPKIRKKEKE